MYSSITFEKLAQWAGGEVFSKTGVHFPVSNISTDTRTLKRGDVYLALRGESFDGNQFLKAAVDAGAIGVICETAEEINIPKIKVEDSLKALIAIGESARSIFRGPVFGITGSAGKSSTKDMVAVLLGENTVSSPASFNNLMGVSRTLCLVEDDTKNLVLEMGMNNFGEIAELCKRFRPQFGMITNIGDAHIGKLGGQEGIYRAKKEMFDFLAADSDSLGVALNGDDNWVIEAYKSAFRHQDRLNFKLKTYSRKNSSADIFLESSFMDPQTGFLNLKIKTAEGNIVTALPIFGEHQAENIIAAIAMVKLVDVPLRDIEKRLKNIKPAKHRGEIIQLAGEKIVIDESYNSNPKALLSSLESLKKLSPRGRYVLVLGEMRELGNFSKQLHEDVGSFLADWIGKERPRVSIVTVRGDSSRISDQIKKFHPSVPVKHVETTEQAKQIVPSLIHSGDIVFIKGSRSVGLDQLLSTL